MALEITFTDLQAEMLLLVARNGWGDGDFDQWIKNRRNSKACSEAMEKLMLAIDQQSKQVGNPITFCFCPRCGEQMNPKHDASETMTKPSGSADSASSTGSTIHADDKKRLEWIDRRLGQLGIDVRQSKYHIQMRYYLELLKEEIGMTERFLSEDFQSP